MKRADLAVLAEEHCDLLVIGGGIYGAMVARDAALRGLRTVLVERGDFGAGTSHNSLKIIHGGIRYVQNLDLRRLRASAREQAFWQRAAPDLIAPLDFVIPLFGYGPKGPEAFAAAGVVHAAASAGVRHPAYPRAAVVGAAAARAAMGALAPGGPLRGGGLWRDGQILDVNRLHLACLEAAAERGARLANRMEAVALHVADGRVVGAALRDHVTGADGAVQARATVCCAGATTGDLLVSAGVAGLGGTRLPRFVRASNLIVARDPAALGIPATGVGVVSRSRADAVVDRGARMYFVTPWQGVTVIGTHEAAVDDPGAAPTDPAAADADVDDFLAEIDHACPGLALDRSDVVHAYQGVIPADIDDARSAARRQRRGSIIDHGSVDGVGGLVSVVGVKYTTARLVAEHAVTLALARGDLPHRPSSSFDTPLPASAVTACRPDDPDWLSLHVGRAVREEMAVTLEDVLLRRTQVAETGMLRGPAGWHRLRAVAAAMAEAAGWDVDRLAREVAATGHLIPTVRGTAAAG